MATSDGGLIEALTREHRRIGRVLAAFEVFLLRVRLGTETSDLSSFARVLSAYSTRWHQPREERVVLVGAQALAPGEVSVPQLVAEHRAIAGLMLVLDRLGSRGRIWTRDDGAVLQRAGRNLVGLMEYHMGNEEHHLFPLLATTLPDNTLDELGREIYWPEEGEIEPSGESHAVANEMVQRYPAAAESTWMRKD